jgi:hypothetical protein
MSQTIELSDEFVHEASIAAEVQDRSVAEQIEFWASLGKTVDRIVLRGGSKDPHSAEPPRPLSELVASIDTDEGRARAKAYLASLPFPHFEAYPGDKRTLVRIEEDGTRAVGRFMDREFVPLA